MPSSRFRVVDSELPYFMTLSVVDWYPLFANSESMRVVLDSLRYLQATGSVCLYGYVVMENHIHLIAHADVLPRRIQQFKSYTATQIVRSLHRRQKVVVLRRLRETRASRRGRQSHRVWRTGYHPQAVVSDLLFEQKLDYMHQNPVRRGWVEEPTHWLPSSARNYAGLPAPIDVTLA